MGGQQSADDEYESVSLDYDNLEIIEDDMDVMQYGEELNIDDAVMEEVNNLSHFDFEDAINDIYDDDGDECKEIIYETPGQKPSPPQPYLHSAYPQMPIASPYLVNVGQSISFSGSGGTMNRQKYQIHGHH